MTNFITKPALTLKALFTLAAVATAIVALPSGPDFKLGASPAYAEAKKIDRVSKSKLKAICQRTGGDWQPMANGAYACFGKDTTVLCTKKECNGVSHPQAPAPTTGMWKATGAMTTGMVTRH